MDLATLFGMVAALGLIGFSIVTGEGADTFVNVPSLVIVVGGTIGATFVCFPMKTVFGVLGVLRKALFPGGMDNATIITQLEGLSKRARKEGLLSLQAAGEDIKDAFYKKGLLLVVDGQEADTIEAILGTEVSAIKSRHTVGADIFKAMGTYAPAFGMIGTIIGLIQMLQTMNDPSSIGPSMAVALITTFYGAVLSNVIFLPLAVKLELRSSIEVAQKKLIMEGLLSIHAGDNPRILVQRLGAYVPPSARPQES
jgi:chemotaxis protein MotA